MSKLSLSQGHSKVVSGLIIKLSEMHENGADLNTQFSMPNLNESFETDPEKANKQKEGITMVSEFLSSYTGTKSPINAAINALPTELKMNKGLINIVKAVDHLAPAFKHII